MWKGRGGGGLWGIISGKGSLQGSISALQNSILLRPHFCMQSRNAPSQGCFSARILFCWLVSHACAWFLCAWVLRLIKHHIQARCRIARRANQSTEHYPGKREGDQRCFFYRSMTILCSSGFCLSTLPWIPFSPMDTWFLSNGGIMNADLILGEWGLQFLRCWSGSLGPFAWVVNVLLEKLRWPLQIHHHSKLIWR